MSSSINQGLVWILVILTLPVAVSAHDFELPSAFQMKPGETKEVIFTNSGGAVGRYEMGFEEGYESWMFIRPTDTGNFESGVLRLVRPPSEGTFTVRIYSQEYQQPTTRTFKTITISVANATLPFSFSIGQSLVEVAEENTGFFLIPSTASGGVPPYSKHSVTGGGNTAIDGFIKQNIGWNGTSLVYDGQGAQTLVTQDTTFGPYTVTLKDSTSGTAQQRSATVSIRITDVPRSSAPPTPTSVNLNVTADTLGLSWTGVVANPAVNYYEFRVFSDPAATVPVGTVRPNPQTDTSISVGRSALGLTLDTPYFGRLYAHNTSGYSNGSSIQAFEFASPVLPEVASVSPNTVQRGDTNIVLRILGSGFSPSRNYAVYAGEGVVLLNADVAGRGQAQRISDSELQVTIAEVISDTPLGTRNIRVLYDGDQITEKTNALTISDADSGAQLLFTSAPTGVLQPGDTATVSYEVSYPAGVRTAAIRLSDGVSQIGGLHDDQININSPSFDHSYDWTVPSDLATGTYFVELVAYLNGTSEIPSILSAQFTVLNNGSSTSFANYTGHLQGDPKANRIATPSLGLGVNSASGNFFYTESDLGPVAGKDLPFTFRRFYNSLAPETDVFGGPIEYPFGKGWTCTYDVFLRVQGDLAEVRWADGRRDGFEKEGASSPWRGSTPGNFHALESEGDGWLITTPESIRYYFNSIGRLIQIRSANDFHVDIAYEASQTVITDTVGREFTLHLSGGKITSLTLPDGASIQYHYGGQFSTLNSVIDRTSHRREYRYAGVKLLRVLYRGTSNDLDAIVSNRYDNLGRIESQQEARQLISNSSLSHRFEWLANKVRYYSPGAQITTVTKDHSARAIALSVWSADDVAEDANVATFSYQAAEGQRALQPLSLRGFNGQTSSLGFDGPFADSLTDPASRSSFVTYANSGLAKHLPTNMVTAKGASVALTNNGKNINGLTISQPLAAQALSPSIHIGIDYSAGLLQATTKGANIVKTEIVSRDIHGNPTTIRFFSDIGSNLFIQESRTYDILSRLVSSSDTTGLRTFYFYDAEDRPTDVVSGPGANYTRTTPASAGVRHSRWEYDPEGRVTVIHHAWGAPEAVWSRYTYNGAGDLFRISNSDNAQVELRYNGDGFVDRRTDVGLGRVDTINYRESYRVTNTTMAADYSGDATPSRLIGSRVDASGRLLEAYIGSRIGSNGEVVDKQVTASYQYDPLGRVKQVKRFEGYLGGVQFRIEKYNYSADGRVTTVIHADSRSGDLGESKVIEVDALGKPIRVTLKRAGESYEATARYNEAGHLIETTDLSGLATSYTRDGLGRVIARTDIRGTYTWVYNDAARTVMRTAPDGVAITTTFNVHGEPVSATGPGISFSFSYDARGRLVLEDWQTGHRAYSYLGSFLDLASTQYSSGAPVSIDYNWDRSTQRLIERTYAGKTLAYSYNGFNEITGIAVSEAAGGALFGSFSFDYHRVKGSLEQVVFPNEIKTQYDWNLLGELEEIKTFRPGEETNPLAHYTITLDGLGRRTQIGFRQPQGAIFPTESVALTHTNGLLTAVEGQSVAMDGRKNITDIPAGPTLTYDALDRVTSIGSAVHRYDAARNRIQSDRAGTVTRYLQDTLADLPNVAATTDGSNLPNDIFIYGPGGLLGGLTSDNQWRIPHQDFNANVIAVTDGASELISSYAYTPYGSSAGAVGDTDYPFRFSGGVGAITDEEELIQMRARYYSSYMRQFTSGDLIAGQVENPMSLGRYNFVEGRVMGGVDPSGLILSVLRGLSSRHALEDNLVLGASYDSAKWMSRVSKGMEGLRSTSISLIGASGRFAPSSAGGRLLDQAAFGLANAFRGLGGTGRFYQKVLKPLSNSKSMSGLSLAVAVYDETNPQLFSDYDIRSPSLAVSASVATLGDGAFGALFRSPVKGALFLGESFHIYSEADSDGMEAIVDEITLRNGVEAGLGATSDFFETFEMLLNPGRFGFQSRAAVLRRPY